MSKIDKQKAPRASGTRYPAPFDQPCRAREWLRLGDAAGLTQFGVNLLHLPPGAWSSQRHWHSHEDEFVYVLEGELTLITDAGEQVLTPGLAAGFPAGVPDGHNLVNKTDKDALDLEIGNRHPEEEAHYPDVDLHVRRSGGAFNFTRKDGSAI